jgi:hypothetical protein
MGCPSSLYDRASLSPGKPGLIFLSSTLGRIWILDLAVSNPKSKIQNPKLVNLAPSILSADFARLETHAREALQARPVPIGFT